ncbi:MAG: DUF4347 domain-containing protein, partial [Pseudomonas sp.]
MSGVVPHRALPRLKPHSQLLALEPRILFDGAAAVAVDQHHDSASNGATDSDHAPSTPTEAPAATPVTEQRTLLVIDSRVDAPDKLTAGLPSNVTVLVVNSQQDGLAAITKALEALGKVDAIQILSHGEAGQLTLGNRTLSAANVDDLGSTLQGWQANLNSGADIQLYGCNIGAGAQGQTLVNEIARWTGADVAASNDNTGAASLGGDWNLEVQVGSIDKALVLGSATLDSYHSLLAAGPNTSLGTSAAEVLLGDQFTFTVNFSNTSSDVGFAPYIDLFMPVTGKDGAGSAVDDGISFVSATYLGQTLVSHVVTFDSNGDATHPLAKDASGNYLVMHAADYGMQAGDQVVVLELPFASAVAGQPTVAVQVTASLSNLADTSFTGGNPALTILARSGFQYGNDALNNPTVDPTIIEAVTHAFVVTPTVITFDQTISTPEGETATGPNYGRSLTVTVEAATGQSLSQVVVTQPLPDNIQVTAINPGPGGTLTSLTLANGTVLTNPAAMQAAITSDTVFISEFTVTYATLTGQAATTVNFYVPDNDANGTAIIDHTTGDDVTINIDAPSAEGKWVPLDSRDIIPPATDVDFAGTGAATSFVAKSITLLKDVTLAVDGGASGITPGDTLRYNLSIAISDYFAFGKSLGGNGSFIVADTLSDGQTVTGTPTLTITTDGQTQTIALITTRVVNADGTTSLAFDVGESMRQHAALHPALNGDLAFDNTLQGAAKAVISYLAIVGQSYTPPAGAPHSEINEGDQLGNNALVTATLLSNATTLTGQSESDGSSSLATIPTSQVDIVMSDLNGGGMPPQGVELNPGDVVTFKVRYDLLTGDYQDFKLTTYLPVPLFDIVANGVAWANGNGPGEWHLGSGNTNPGAVTSVVSGPGNSVVFSFGNYVNSGTTGSTIEVEFTLVVSDQPFPDARAFNVLAESSQTTTLTNQTLTSDDVTLIASVAEPRLTISHGVVSADNGTVTGTTGSWTAPGTSGVPFSGSITDISAVNGSVSGIDGADTLRLATAIENSGGGSAYDVATRVVLPSGLSFVGGSLGAANLQVYRGDGTLLTVNVDYSVSGNTITFIDGDGQGALLAGRAGTANDLSGANVVVITYDATVSSSIAASATLQSTAHIDRYSGVEGGANFIQTPTNDTALQQIAAPSIALTYAGGSLDNNDSSANHTSGANLVIGESMLYDIVITLPEGGTQNLSFDDLIPPGMKLDTTYNGSGYQLITTGFAGSVAVQSIAGSGGTLGADGVDARITMSANSLATADNNSANNSFVVRVRLVASDVAGNQAGVVLTNDAKLTYTDPDGNTANGTTPLNRDVALSGGKPTVTVVEPTLSITQTLLTPTNNIGFDEGSVLTFTVTITNSGGLDAFDISLLNLLPSQLSSLSLLSTAYNNGATDNGSTGFEISGGQLRSVAGANIDMANGSSIVLTIQGTVNATAANVPSFDNVATVQWTSLNGSTGGTADPVGERTGVTGPLNGGTLDDYQLSSTLTINTATGLRVSRIGGLPDTAAPVPTNAALENVAIGEIIRYRVVAVIPEGSRNGYQIQITLANGLEFIPANLNSVLVGLISNSGELSSSVFAANGERAGEG